MEKRSSVLCVIALLLGIALFSTVEIAGKEISNIAKIESFVMVFVRFFVTVGTVNVTLLAAEAGTYMTLNMETSITIIKIMDKIFLQVFISKFLS